MLNIICDLVAIAGFVLSITNLILTLRQNHKKLKIRFGDSGTRERTSRGTVFKIHYSIENLSQLPIAITRIQIQAAGKLYDCERLPYVIEESTRKVGKEIIDRTVLKSVTLPINLPALGAESGFLAFLVPQGTLSKHDKDLIFRICTNRGKAVQMSFSRYEDKIVH